MTQSKKLNVGESIRMEKDHPYFQNKWPIPVFNFAYTPEEVKEKSKKVDNND